MPEKGQKRFSNLPDHIVLRPELRKKMPKAPTKGKRKGRFPQQSTVGYLALVNRVSSIIQKEAEKEHKILEYNKLHFLIELSDSITWKPIANSIEKLQLSIIEYITDRKIRVAIEKGVYEKFFQQLEENHKYIQDMRDLGPSEKVGATLFEEMAVNPAGKSWVSIEFSSVSGIEDPDLIFKALSTWAEQENYGALIKSYSSENTLLLSGNLVNRGISQIINEVEQLSYIAKIPEMQLRSFSPIKLSSVIPLGDSTMNRNTNSLQTVAIIDSGINSGHNRLGRYIENTFDYITGGPGPCADNVGHGSMVSGLAIYGSDFAKNNIPSAKVVMVKNFELNRSGSVEEINRDTIGVIHGTIDRYRFISRILNLSFNAAGPNPSLTRALDEIAFLYDFIIVVSAGNISNEAIGDFLNAGLRYPDYINGQVVFFPADCRNVLTVGSHTLVDSNFVKKDNPSPFTKSGFSESIIKPEVMAAGGNYCHSMNGPTNLVGPAPGLGVISASNVGSQQLEDFGTSFSSPVVANIVAQILERYLGLSVFLVKALLVSSCQPMTNSNYRCFPATIQGFGKVDRLLAVSSQEWRVCYLMQGDFDKRNLDEYHRYSFLFPEEADQLEIAVSCGKLHTVYGDEHDDFVRLYFNRPGVKPKTPLKKGVMVGSRKCSGTYKQNVTIERGSRGRWVLDVFPHFSKLPTEQRIKYGIVVTVKSSKMIDIYSAISKWIEPQKERLLVPAIVGTPARRA